MATVHREETKFNPVIISLETQEEVDTMYALLNFRPIMSALGCPTWVVALRNSLSEHQKATVVFMTN